MSKSEFAPYSFDGNPENPRYCDNFGFYDSMAKLKKEMKAVGAVFFYKWYPTPFFIAVREKYHGGYIWSRPIKLKATGEVIGTVRARRLPPKKKKK